ncbi:MAG: hypothetical protein MSIBF_04785 [Candidatus Altiarchaeales archaeon IMC4]|nr:MAG: hypothetical protein MSIBF_04785 [Candidatus Altiarchaeales archaeon IMC4]
MAMIFRGIEPKAKPPCFRQPFLKRLRQNGDCTDAYQNLRHKRTNKIPDQKNDAFNALSAHILQYLPTSAVSSQTWHMVCL